MKISVKTDYALRALFTLVEHYGRGPIPIGELARRNEIPKKFLEHIMLDLKSQGWVQSVMGKQGGYVLAKDPAKITAGQVVRYFDGILAPINCVSISHPQKCTQEPVCRMRRLFLDVRNDIVKFMDHTTLKMIYQGTPVSRTEIYAPELLHGAGI
jgi:Rrf2 family protein